MIVNILFILLLPLLFVGIINKVKAIWAGRKGASLLQPYYDVFRLLRKQEVVSQTTSFVFDVASSLSLAAILVAALLIPFGHYQSIISFKGDFILFAYLLGLSKFFSVLSAMDTGSSFEGMGCSRELSYTSFLEPAFFIIIATIAYATGLSSLSQLVSFHTVELSNEWSVMVSVLTFLGLFIVLLVEGSRIPFDDPTTHLELTMVHEVMILDHSGTNAAYVHYANSLKMTLYASLITYFLIPWGKGLWVVTGLYLVIMFAIAMLVGLVESWLPRVRMTRNPELVLVPLSIALLTMCALIALHYGGVQ